jgi:hypothetical protein
MHKNTLLILAVLFLFFQSSHSCDDFTEESEYLTPTNFTRLMKKKFPLNSIQWILPEDIHSKSPEDHIWVNEGDAGYMITPFKTKKGIATTGLLSCTALTAFSKDGYPAFAHISDLVLPSNVLNFLREMNVDTERPITLISKTCNTQHLLKLKWYLEDTLDISPVLKTLPIFVDRNQIKTCFSKRALEILNRDIRGISVAMNADGDHSFFYQSEDEQERIRKYLSQYRHDWEGYSTLYVTQLPYSKKL